MHKIQKILSNNFEHDIFTRDVIVSIFQGKVKDFQIFRVPQKVYINESELKTAKSVIKYGSFSTDDGVKVNLFEVILQPNTIIERNKVTVGSIIKKYMYGKTASLVSFVYPNAENNNWRFSFIRHEPKLVAGEGLKIEETNPKRFTYILGPGESCRTAAERLQSLSDSKSINIDDIQEAFSVDKLSKQFFDEYTDVHYKNFCDYLYNSNFMASIFGGDEKEVRNFVKKLLGRIVFLNFVQKKGWLGVPIDGKWGDGDKNFMHNIFKDFGRKDSFYQIILDELFFETLNTKRDEDLAEIIEGKKVRIPYLNGGLFDRDMDAKVMLTFPPELFSELFNFFDQYNFTIYEDDPDNQTIAIDPEMLGHIFENLLEDNKDKGAYYTPKEIVHYMTQESLIEYLCTKMPQLEREAVEKFIRFDITEQLGDDSILQQIQIHLDDVRICDPAIGSGAFPMGLLLEIMQAKEAVAVGLGEENFDHYEEKLGIIQNSIYGVDIEAGAVDIARLRFWLSLVIDEHGAPRPLPNLKYKIVVGDSLISKLDDEIMEIDWDIKVKSKAAKTLEKNLEEIVELQRSFFMPESDKRKLEKQIRLKKIDILQSQIKLNTDKLESKNATSDEMFGGTKKGKKKLAEFKMEHERLKALHSKLEKIKKTGENFKHFDWKLDFPEIMNEHIANKVGFDIVIANPPYLGEKGNKDKFQILKEWTLKKFYMRKMDIYYFFIHQGINLAKVNAILSFITTNYYPTANGAKKLRKDIKENTAIKTLINLNELQIFESAKGQHNLITILEKTQDKEVLAKSIITHRKGVVESNLLGSILQAKDSMTDRYYLKQKEIYDGTENYIRFIGKSSNSNNPLVEILNKISKNNKTMGDLFNISQGILTGADRVTKSHIKKYPEEGFVKGKGIYILNNKEAEYFGECEWLKPFYKNSDINKYKVNEKCEKYVLYLTRDLEIDNKSQVKKHIERYEKIIKGRSKNRGEIQAALKMGKYWVIFAARTKTPFSAPKIVAPQRSKKNVFGYTEEEWYASADVYYITQNTEKHNLKYILALLNSKLYYIWFYHRGKRKGESLELFYTPLCEVPLKMASKNIQNSFVKRIDEILTAKKQNPKADTKALEDQIDIMVYKLYGLSYDEVLIVDPDFGELMGRDEYAGFEI